MGRGFAEVAAQFNHFLDDSGFSEPFSVPQAASRTAGD